MKMVLPFLLLATLAAPLAAQAPDQPAGATPGQRRSDQERAYDARRKGYEYLGFDLDFATSVYTLKFMRDGVVVWVDVDGRSGQIIGRTGK
jgi:hypothetical protein